MKLDIVGDGVYSIREDILGIQPKVVNLGELDSPSKKAIAIIVNFSAEHNAWCGVAWPKLIEKMHEEYKDQEEFSSVKSAFEWMINDGLLETAVYCKNGYFKWLDKLFAPRIICPTTHVLTKFHLDTLK